MEETNGRVQQLDASRDKAWVTKRAGKLTLLPGPERERIRSIISTGKSPEEILRYASRIEDAAKHLDSLSERKRLAFFKTLFPRLGEHLYRCWIDATLRPYQHGFSRKPFRGPNRTAEISICRGLFVVSVCDALRGLDPDPEWLAAWAPYFNANFHDPRTIGWVLASVLRAGGSDADAVRKVLVDSINGDHPIGHMGRHAIVALLNSDEPSDWEIIGKLLLAAQRQEGLRQSILESVDEANPRAYRYMLGLILEHNLSRFSATVRAYDVWFGMNWGANNAKGIEDILTRVCALLDDDTQRRMAISSTDPEETFIALWVTAFVDASEALKQAMALLHDTSAERRFVALRMLKLLQLEPDAFDAVVERVTFGIDEDPRVQAAFIEILGGYEFTKVPEALFQAVAKYYEVVPVKAHELEPIVWPWFRYAPDKRKVAELLRKLAIGAPEKLLPYLPLLSSYQCATVIEELSGTGFESVNYKQVPRKRRKLSPEARQLIIKLTADPRDDVQKAAFDALAGVQIEQDEIDQHLTGLHRSAGTFRTRVLARLSKVPAKQLLKIATPLLDDPDRQRLAAGVELVSHVAESGEETDAAKAILESRRERLEQSEFRHALNRILGAGDRELNYDDCLGLVPQGSRTPAIKPNRFDAQLDTPGAISCLRELGELFLQHGNTEVVLCDSMGAKERRLLSAASYLVSIPEAVQYTDAQVREKLPLAQIWIDWLIERPKSTRDPDGLELVRVWLFTLHGNKWKTHMQAPFRAERAWDLTTGFTRLTAWLARLSNPQGVGEFSLQRIENALAHSMRTKRNDEPQDPYRHKEDLSKWSFNLATSEKESLQRSFPSPFSDKQLGRIGALTMIAMDCNLPQCSRGPSIPLFLAAHAHGYLNEFDLIWLLLRPRYSKNYDSTVSVSFGPIDLATSRKRDPRISASPALSGAIDRMRARLLDIELKRGEKPTLATAPASRLAYSGGAELVIRLLESIGRSSLTRRSYPSPDATRVESFSQLLCATHPTDSDTPEEFAELVKRSSIPRARLLELSVLTPQWASHVEVALNIPGLEDAVWWIHAHTKCRDFWSEGFRRDLWESRLAQRTPLDSDDLEEGAVDVAWFSRTLTSLGKDHWNALQKVAKYASSNAGHVRAQLFAAALLNVTTCDEFLERAGKKRHQDSVRAIGLCPLSANPAEALQQTLTRFKFLQEFLRQSRAFGSQRQASERRAVEIGMQNLARTAGYSDPVRLQWAMEAEAVADLAAGAVALVIDETALTLAITPEGDPELQVTKKGKALKAVPAALRKNKEAADFRARVTELRRQKSRMRTSLEAAMCRGDLFTAAEFAGFFAHPMLRPQVERLVFINSSGATGYPDKHGRALRHHSSRLEPVGKSDLLRIAHPMDFLASKDWSDWQRECFAAERVQPFKQLFREAYPRTSAELENSDMTRRYAGHQVNPRQALSLLRQRQWIFSPEEGVRRTYHEAKITAELWFQEYFHTPAEVECLSLEGISFLQGKRNMKRVLLKDVPDRLFSEAMRDMDLVVSVAHAGAVDPEASASTIEMRATLLRETCQLLKLSNVRVQGHHAIIDGTRATYSIHLGSATTRIDPGRILIIVAIHSQHRGRLFLPFADDDPRTAEVLSKSLLLARDHEIKDPSILEQIHA